MSEFDSLSDSDWLDISSGRDDSDDNVSLSSDSNHGEISSMPHSRRSSISVASSMNSEVEAWEGFVSDNGDEVAPDAHPEAVIGMYHVPLPSALEPEPITAGLFIPDVDQLSAAPPEVVDEEDRRVKDALDQSFIGTLSASRSSTTGGHFASTHTSINDLRLSFPDPLTRSHNNELNSSYQAVSSAESSDSQRSDNDDTQELTIASTISSSPTEDPGMIATTPEVQCHGDQQCESDEKSQLEIVLYGASSEIKWHFIQQLIQKAAANAGRVLINPLHSGAESDQVQTIRLYKDSDAFKAPFFNAVTVYDRTGDTLPPKFELDTLNGDPDPDHLSLAVVYLPTAKLPTLRLHTSFLPVLVSSSSILPADFDGAVALQAAEDDWDLLCVPADKTLNIGGTRSPVFDSNKLLHITSEQAYGVLHDIGRETKKVTLKPITEQVKSVNAVTLFALMSIIMGFAFNTAFRPSTPAPTPTVNTPSSSNWGIFCPLPNRSVVASSSNTVPLKDMAISVFNPDMTALSVTPPPTSMALSVASSSSKAVAEITNISPMPSSRKCIHCKSASDKSQASTDMVIRLESATPSSDVHVKPSVSITPRTDGSSSSGGSNNIVFEAQTASSSSGDPKATTSNPKVVIGSVSDVLDATSKAIENVGNEIAYLSEAADELISSLRIQRDNLVSQSKGKARALGEQIQNLNEEMVYRNERAKTRAKKLKKHGEEMLWNTQEMLKKRTEKAKKRAKELGKSVLESDAWVTYQKVQEEMESRLSGGGGGGKGQMGKQKKIKKGKENSKACRKESRRLLRNKRQGIIY